MPSNNNNLSNSFLFVQEMSNMSVNERNSGLQQPSINAAPPDIPDPDLPNSLFVQEMNSMSINERNQVYEDIHGVATGVQEEPDFILECCCKLQMEIDKISHKPAFELAAQRSPDYVNGRSLRLMFLRSTNFDTVKAAAKLVAFFENQRIYFGDDVLGRRILWSDLNKNDKDFLRKGWVQVLPFRDKGGRAVLWDMLSKNDKKDTQTTIRASWYHLMARIDDDETQKNGLVVVSCDNGVLDLSVEARTLYWKGANFVNYMPIKFSSFHFCMESPRLSPLFSLARLFVSKDVRARIRSHHGTPTEWMYSLMTFGIPVTYAPMSQAGDIKSKYHKQWLARYRQLEAREIEHATSSSSSSVSSSSCFSSEPSGSIRKEIELPSPRDILLGKGSLVQQYSGNLHFHHVVDKHKQRYIDASMGEKKDIALELFRILDEQEHARFLERNGDGWWVPVAKATALKKIAHRLRLKVASSSSSSPSSPSYPTYVTSSNGNAATDKELTTSSIKNADAIAAPSSTADCSCDISNGNNKKAKDDKTGKADNWQIGDGKRFRVEKDH